MANDNRPRLIPFDIKVLERFNLQEPDPAKHKKMGWGPLYPNFAFGNPGMGNFIQHVQWVAPNGMPTYDQVLRMERCGGVFLPFRKENNELKFGLLTQWRPNTSDPDGWNRDLDKGVIDVGKLGRESIECPRGFAQTGEKAKDTSLREAQEESQSVVTRVLALGYYNDNTTFSPQMTALQAGEIDLTRKPADKPDANERLVKGVTFYSLTEISQLVREERLYCSYTLGALQKFSLLVDSRTLQLQ